MNALVLQLRAEWPDAERSAQLMHNKSRVEFHEEVIDLRKQESKLKKLLSIPRRKLDHEELVESL